MVKIVKRNGDPLFKTITPRTRLKFSIGVIIANFIMGIVCILVGGDLTALGVFLAMANSPLYVYVLGQSFSPTKIPDSYYNQSHSGAGGLGTIVQVSGQVNNNQNQENASNSGVNMGNSDGYNVPQNMKNTDIKPVKVVKKDESEIG